MEQEEKWLLTEKYQNITCDAFVEDCIRLKNGEPLAYIIGHIPFLNCNIYLDSLPLIPRVETEYWCELLINTYSHQYIHTKRELKILDLCAGSGCIGVALAKNLNNTTITFAEIDSSHLKTIKKNTITNISLEFFSKYCNVVVSDLFSGISSTYDLIVANPPYIDQLANSVSKSVSNYEPSKALYADEKGFKLIEIIIKHAHKFLNKQGQIWIEHEPKHVDSIYKVADKYKHITTGLDQYKKPRYTILGV